MEGGVGIRNFVVFFLLLFTLCTNIVVNGLFFFVIIFYFFCRNFFFGDKRISKSSLIVLSHLVRTFFFSFCPYSEYFSLKRSKRSDKLTDVCD